MAPDYNSSSSNTNSQSCDNFAHDTESEAIKQLLDEAKGLLCSSSSSGRLLYAFVRRNLCVFHLNGDFCEAAILNEALIRAVTATRKGIIIQELPAWLRGAAYNIIREKSRDRKKLVPLESETDRLEQIVFEPEDIEEDLRFIAVAFGMLEARDQRLLTLKLVDGLSWQEIHEILSAEGQHNCSIPALRKQKERALIRLRKKFHALKPEL